MEASQQLFGDSFSNGCLINMKPSFESLSISFRHSFNGSSFIEIDPDFFSMRRTSDAHDFNFNLSSTQSPVSAHADQIISNGHLLPLHLNTPPPQSEAVPSRHVSSSNSSPLFHSTQSTPILMSSCSSKSVASRSGKFKSPFFKNCMKSPKKNLWMYLCFLMPLYEKVKGLILTSPKSVRSCRGSVGNSPRMTTAFSSIDWHREHADSLIYDAILCCKKSIISAITHLQL